MERFKVLSNINFQKLPKTTGVYSFYNKNQVIYIGKAINIRERVKNHFQQPSYRDEIFINKANRIGFFETNSEIEALILEANLIKKYQPKYNVMWRDDKNYFWVAFEKGKDEIPYVFITHQPSINLQTKNYKLKTVHVGPFVEGAALKKTLRFLRKVFPYYTTKKHPKIKCTYCHLDLCPGPEPDIKNYIKNIKKIILVLRGRRNAALNSLKKEMRRLSKENKFEEAGKIRDRIYALQYIMSHTRVIEPSSRPPTLTLGVAMQAVLGLNKTPIRIECYDVSNIQGKEATGSMVVFTNGAPDKNNYRKFRIKITSQPNDIAMLKETLERRFAHSEWTYPDLILVDGGKAQLNAAINSKLEYRNPKQILNSKIQNIKIISIAKGKQELFIEGVRKPIPLKDLPQQVYNLVKRLDDEAHRFAVSYHRKLRQKRFLH